MTRHRNRLRAAPTTPEAAENTTRSTIGDLTHGTRKPATDPLRELRRLPVPPARGWKVPGAGRDHHVAAPAVWQGTTTQLAGLYPFVGGSGSRVRGVPIGHDLHTHEPIGLHPAEWMHTGLTSNTGIWIQAQPGAGKSALAKRLAVGMTAFGWNACICGDIKGEYAPLVRQLGGSVITIGRGQASLNPLDPGPLGHALATLPAGHHRDALREAVRARQTTLLDSLLTLELRRPTTAPERAWTARALDIAVAAAGDGQATIPDVLHVLAAPPQEVLRAAYVSDSTERYYDLHRDILCALELLCSGPLRGLFDRRSTVQLDTDAVGMTSVDISALDEESDDVVATSMLCAWAWCSGMIEARQAGRGRNLLWIQDEAWRALRAGAGLVEQADRMTRLARHRGVASVYLTHSMDDLQALPTAEDRAKAKGIAARCSVHIYGGLPASEVDTLAVTLSQQEAQLLASWQSAGTWVPGTHHPGRGHYLIKAGERAGLPIRMHLTRLERDLYDTDAAFAQDGAR